jgi:hypothetical protein
MLKRLNWGKLIKDVVLILVAALTGAYNSDAIGQILPILNNN